jgi:hypothetical protein
MDLENIANIGYTIKTLEQQLEKAKEALAIALGRANGTAIPDHESKRHASSDDDAESSKTAQIISYLKSRPGERLKVKDVQDALPEFGTTFVRTTLFRLARSGNRGVKKLGRGKYKYVGL